jgi:hypothetical protein
MNSNLPQEGGSYERLKDGSLRKLSMDEVIARKAKLTGSAAEPPQPEATQAETTSAKKVK